MQATRVPVCTLGLFNAKQDIWMDSLENLLQKYPVLAAPHTPAFYLILCIDKGEGALVVDQDRIRFRSGQVLIIKPNCINTITLEEGSTGTVIGFTTDFFSLRYNTNVLHQFSYFNEGNQTAFYVPQEAVKGMQFLLWQMLEEFRMQKKATQKVLRSYLNILLIELDRIHVPQHTIKIHNALHEKIQKYQMLIEQHFKTHKMPSEYADMLHISTNYLNKICRTILGQTSGNLIKQHIILEAKRLLSYTTHSISEIANELGFEHASYFVTIFKKATNQTPEQYRKSQWIA
ncbi:AraC family transcriptional regulator [Myroides fluvii]|uniref:AraC family transcriptional regulator n=1 Tax=Myroides fluvii TaxID=2572594 RepID=UPI00131B9351|nr:helix-turn-helix transcriptional regulator [Myroides fluvii]